MKIQLLISTELAEEKKIGGSCRHVHSNIVHWAKSPRLFMLSATISYIIMEAFDFRAGLSKTPGEAKLFYFIIGISMCFGIAMHWLHISSIKALLLTTILYGIAAPLLITIILHVANSNKIMGQYKNNRISNISGIIILLFMLANLNILGYFLLVH